MAGLEDYYFEDSYVLAIEVHRSGATLTVDAVMSRSHPHVAPPKPGEQYAYERIALQFVDATSVRYEPSRIRPNLDPSGVPDLGNIDTFGASVDGTFRLEGEWGLLEFWGATVHVEPSGRPRSDSEPETSP